MKFDKRFIDKDKKICNICQSYSLD